MSHAIGAKSWVMALGRIPPESQGAEPECTSRDQIVLLNANTQEVQVEIEIFYSDRDPIGPYRIHVQPRRLRVVRFNDLIDPLPVPLDEDFAAVIRADRPIVVQGSRFDSSPRGEYSTLPVVWLDKDV